MSGHRVVRLHPEDDVVIALDQLATHTASGRSSRSELHGYGQQEFVPWQLSVIT